MTLFLQNNGDKRIWVIPDITPDITNHLWVKFEDFEFPEDCPDGEYTYALVAGNITEYQLKAEMLDTLINDMTLRELHPAVGLLRIGTLEMPSTPANTYEPENEDGQNNKHYYYYSK